MGGKVTDSLPLIEAGVAALNLDAKNLGRTAGDCKRLRDLKEYSRNRQGRSIGTTSRVLFFFSFFALDSVEWFLFSCAGGFGALVVRLRMDLTDGWMLLCERARSVFCGRSRSGLFWYD